MTHDFLNERRTLRPILMAGMIAMISAIAASCVIAADPASDRDIPASVRESLSTYLDTFKLGAEARETLDAAGGWSADKQNTCLKLLARLSAAPSSRSAAWIQHAGPAGDVATSPEGFRDRFVRIRGRAVFVAPVPLPSEQAELHDRSRFDLVRIVTDDGLAADVMTGDAPRHWQRSKPIDVRTEAVGLVVSGPPVAASPASTLPAGPSGEADWPAEPAMLLVVAPRVAWFPDTPLGNLGMDYGLFDTVADGHKLLPSDGDAFYAMLAAVGRATQEGIEAVAPKSQEIIPLIDPGAKWIEKHRGDPVRITGIARRATRIEVDDPLRRKQIGGDHYWELFVFVETPTIQIGDRIQNDFPIVCCVRSLPKEMPAGEPMAERVEVAGFAMKRYAYPLTAGEGQEVDRRQTPLLIGRQAIWLPAPSARQLTATLGWIFTSLAAVVLAMLAAAALTMMRRSRRRDREPLPDRIDVE